MDYQQEKKRKEELKRLHEQNERENIKRKLIKDIERNIKTVMIGAISDMEEGFGVYWGHGEDKEKLDEDQLHDREIWETVRNNILNRGNKLIRASTDQISECIIAGVERYVYNFKFDNND